MLKRMFDVIVAATLLLLLLPVFLLIGIQVQYKLGSPVLFRQIRPGLHGAPFTILKFRTMKFSQDAEGKLLSDNQRLTDFGRWLRATSLDELPELWNVLCGDMSLVGPRPLLMDYLELYSPEQSRRHEMRPGITGWAQINGRNSLSWEEKFSLDVWYIDNQSFWLDIKILLLTLKKVVAREGINSDSNTTMPFFKGSSSSEKE